MFLGSFLILLLLLSLLKEPLRISYNFLFTYISESGFLSLKEKKTLLLYCVYFPVSLNILRKHDP